MTQTPRISLTFGAFSCDIEGIADPLALMQRLVTFCEEVERRNPDFGKSTIPLAALQQGLATEGPVEAEMRDGRLVLSAPNATALVVPAAPAPQPAAAPATTIASVEDIESKAVDLPDHALSSALDKAMQETANREGTQARPVLSLAEYARARRPRRIQDALEIAAAYAYHARGEEQFDGVKILTEVGQIDIGKPTTMPERIEAFGLLLDRGTFKVAGSDNTFTLSRAVALRYR